MTSLRLAAVAAALVSPLLATRASAQVYVAPDLVAVAPVADPLETARERFAAADHRLVLDGALALDWGLAHATPLPGTDFAIGPDAEIAAHLGRLAVVGQYSMAWLAPIIPNGTVGSTKQPQVVTPGSSESTTTTTMSGTTNGDAFEQRLGAAVRFSVLRDVVPGRVHHHTRGMLASLWLEGGLGEEFIDYEGNHFHRRDVELGVGGSLDWRGASSHAGQFWAFRFTMAPPLPSDAVTCGGTCTPEPSGKIDKGLLAVYGWTFGN
jgi:hypothetical protein